MGILVSTHIQDASCSIRTSIYSGSTCPGLETAIFRGNIVRVRGGLTEVSSSLCWMSTNGIQILLPHAVL